MMKTRYTSKQPLALLVVGVVLSILGVLPLQAQGPYDAYNNVRTATNGTARAQALGGAVGALGADPSAFHVNPAGIGLYWNSAFSITADPGWAKSNVKWGTGADLFNGKNNYSIGGFANVSSVSTLPSSFSLGRGGSNIRFNLGFSFNRDFDYNRSYTMITSGIPYGIADYTAMRGLMAKEPYSAYVLTDKYDPFMQSLDPLVSLGVNAAWIESYTKDGSDPDDSSLFRTYFSEPRPGGEGPEDRVAMDVLASQLRVNERGGINSFDFVGGASVNDRFYFGASLRVTSYSYLRSSTYREDLNFLQKMSPNNSYLEYWNSLSSRGASVGINLGALVALGDYGRIGISYLTPQYLSMSETYNAESVSYNDTFKEGDKKTSFTLGEMDSSYAMLVPGKLTVSAIGLLGRFGLVSYDFQYRNLGRSVLYSSSHNRLPVSDAIREDYGSEITHRVGVEVRPLSRLALRAGFSYTDNPAKAQDFKQEPAEGTAYDAFTAGLFPSFTIPRSYTSYSGGLGYSLSRSWSLDLAYVHSVRKEKVYPFSGLYSEEDGLLRVKGGDLSEARNNIVVTLNYRF